MTVEDAPRLDRRAPQPRRRREDREGPLPVDLQHLPSWLRAAVFLGVPSVIALFLVYVLTTQLSDRIQRMEQAQSLQTQTIAALKDMGVELRSGQGLIREDTIETRQHFDDAVARIDRLLRRVCLVTARSNDERNVCLGKTE